MNCLQPSSYCQRLRMRANQGKGAGCCSSSRLHCDESMVAEMTITAAPPTRTPTAKAQSKGAIMLFAFAWGPCSCARLRSWGRPCSSRR